MRLRTLCIPVVGLLGAAVAAIPTLAAGDSSATTASFTAVDYAWDVTGGSGHQATIPQGGTVGFSYPTGTSIHNADFSSGPQPSSCTQTAGQNSGSVPPLPHDPASPGWSGTCTFNTPGTYTFFCDAHPFMKATIVVQASGTTTTTSRPPTTTTSSSTTGPRLPGSTTITTSSTTGGSNTNPGSTGSPLAGTTNAIAIATNQRGASVRGSLKVSAAGAGGRLEVDVFASRAALQSTRRPALIRVARLVRRSLRPGIQRFSLRLDTAARRALRRHKRLALSVKVVLASPRGARVSVTRRVVLRA